MSLTIDIFTLPLPLPIPAASGALPTAFRTLPATLATLEAFTSASRMTSQALPALFEAFQLPQRPPLVPWEPSSRPAVSEGLPVAFEILRITLEVTLRTLLTISEALSAAHVSFWTVDCFLDP